MSAYTPRELAGLTFGSFRFSQGDAFIQPRFIEYVVARERDSITSDTLELSLQIAAAGTAKFIRRPDLHAVDDRPQSTRPQDHTAQMESIAKVWKKALREVETDDTWLQVRILGDGIVARDYKYLVERGGRPRSGTAPNAELARPYLSHIVHYGMLGNTTGYRIYDDLFCDVSAQLPNYWSSHIRSMDRRSKRGDSYVGVLGSLVAGVAQVHFRHYPQEYEALSTEWRNQLLVAPQPFSVKN